MIPGSDNTQACSNSCCKGYDGFEIGFTSGKGNLRSAISSANSATTVQDWSFVGAPPSGGTSPPPPTGGSYPADTCKWG